MILSRPLIFTQQAEGDVQWFHEKAINSYLSRLEKSTSQYWKKPEFQSSLYGLYNTAIKTTLWYWNYKPSKSYQSYQYWKLILQARKSQYWFVDIEFKVSSSYSLTQKACYSFPKLKFWENQMLWECFYSEVHFVWVILWVIAIETRPFGCVRRGKWLCLTGEILWQALVFQSWLPFKRMARNILENPFSQIGENFPR